MQSVSGGAVIPSIIVAGAGTAAVNGTYTERGTANGFPYYNLVGEPDDPDSKAVSYYGGEWEIVTTNHGVGMQYYGTLNTPNVWDEEWEESSGSLPVPTVTQG